MHAFGNDILKRLQPHQTCYGYALRGAYHIIGRTKYYHTMLLTLNYDHHPCQPHCRAC